MVERQIDSMVRNFEARLAQQGLKLADFMKYTGQDEKSFRGQYRDQAEKSVRANLVLEAVENVENFEVSRRGDRRGDREVCQADRPERRGAQEEPDRGRPRVFQGRRDPRQGREVPLRQCQGRVSNSKAVRIFISEADS